MEDNCDAAILHDEFLQDRVRRSVGILPVTAIKNDGATISHDVPDNPLKRAISRKENARARTKRAGKSQMRLQEEDFDLTAGHLLALDRAIPHDAKALEDSAFLLTITWPKVSKRH